MARDIKKILISTMPRSGTVFVFDFIAKLFEFKKISPSFSNGVWPEPPEWDPYKFDKTYLHLQDYEVLCAHYLLESDIRELINNPDVLVMYLYRDPRDAAVSATLYIKNVLTEHPLFSMFSNLSNSEAIAFMLSGGIVNVERKNTTTGCDYLIHQGMRYFCDTALDWVAEPKVAKLRYEDFFTDPLSCLKTALEQVDVEIEKKKIQQLAIQLNFSSFSDGRVRGEEDVRSHFRKGISGDHRNYFNDLHKAICKSRFGSHLVDLGYEETLSW